MVVKYKGYFKYKLKSGANKNLKTSFLTQYIDPNKKLASEKKDIGI
jgi:hypothetical protein